MKKAVIFGVVALIGMMIGFGPRLITEYDLAKARDAIRHHEPEQALVFLERAKSRHPSNSDVHFLLARCHRRLGHLALVRKHLEFALNFGHSKKAISREEWLALAQSGQMSDADPHLSELLIDAGEDGAEICQAYVNGYLLNTRFSEAMELLDVWQKAYPDDPQPYLFRGRYLDAHGSLSAATETYREGYKRAPKRKDFRVSLARCLVALQQHTEAAELLSQLQSAKSQDQEVLEILANSYVQQGQLAEAKSTLSEILRLTPDDPKGQLLLARVALQEGNSEEALRLLKILREVRPYDIEARYSYASALMAVGEKQRANDEFQFVTKAREEISEARKKMEIVSQKEPDNIELRFQIGSTLLRYESPESGAGWLRSVLEIDPNHQPTHEALANYYQLIGNRELEKSHRQHAVEQKSDQPSEK